MLDGEMSTTAQTRAPNFWVRAYATADPRSLGLFRVALGMLLFIDVLRRLPDLDAHYTNAGWFTNHFALFRPMSDHFFSIYTAFGTPGEVRVLFFAHLLVNFLLIIGFRTRLVHVLAAILITSINCRTIMLENGGWVVLNLLAVWSMFLPCGRRFSVDALLTSLRRSRDVSESALNDPSFLPRDNTPVVSLAVTALILQYGVIYYFNVVHKTGLPWRDGTAVYYFLQQDRMVTSFGALVRQFIPLGVIKMLTWSTLVIEASIAALVLAPFKTHRTRMIAWALVCMLHLSIDALVQLGPFSWAMVSVFFVFIPRQFWDALERRAHARKAERVVVYDAESGFAIAACRLIRRFDLYGRLSFIALKNENAVTAAALPEQAVLAANQTLVVAAKDGSGFWTGSEALRRLGDALPLGFSLSALRLPLVSVVVDRMLEWIVNRRTTLSERLELDTLVREPAEPPAAPSGAAEFWQRLGNGLVTTLVLVVMVAETSQVLIENRVLPMVPNLEQDRPAWMAAIVVYPRLFQGWSMFAPAPPNDDGHVVVDGRTEDGRKLDPLTGASPNFEVDPPGGYHMNQLWGDFHRRIGEPRFSAYWDGFREFLLQHHELTGRPRDRLVAFDVWYLSEFIPPPGVPSPPPDRHKLFSYGTMP